jgi:hypothetical protein
MPPQGFQQPPVSKTNGAAIASLICGILGCVPFITSLAAIILGIFGIKSANKRQGSGKAMAIIGLVLGIIGVFGWSLGAGGMVALVRGSAAPRAAARAFVQDLASANVTAAMAKCDPAVKIEDVTAASQSLQQMGALKDVTAIGVNVSSTSASAARWTVAGAATFDKGNKSFKIDLEKSGDTYKVVKFEIE